MTRHTHDHIRTLAGIASLALATACNDAVPTATHPPATLPGETPSLAVTAEAASGPTKSVLPTGEGLGTYPGLAPSPTRTRYRTEYHSGQVITAAVNVYFIWYGTWLQADGSEDPAIALLSEMTATIGNSPYFRINTLYPDGNGAAPSGGVVYSGAAYDVAYSHGATLSKSDVTDEVSDVILSGGLPLDLKGIYVVMASPDVYVEGFADRYCAYHDIVTVVGAQVRVVLIDGPARAPTRCQPQSVGPSGNAAADAAASLLAAELSNTIVDPAFTGWYDRLGLEPADKCAWTYGTTYQTANGALANINVGGHHLLLQQLWIPTKNGGTCGMKFPGT